MTFVSALFSRTHFNANYFAVLNESFKVISLFSYQSSLFCCRLATFISYQISKCLSTTFLTFFSKLFVFVVSLTRQLVYIITSCFVCQHLFYFSLQTEACKDQIQAVSARSELVYYTALFLICQALFLLSDSASQVHPKEKALLK